MAPIPIDAAGGGPPAGKEHRCTACAFTVRSETEDEVVDFVQRPAREIPDRTMARADVERLWKTG